jgi:hypothetical protein
MLVSRLDQARRKVFMGDLDMATIADTVGLAAIEPLWRDAAFREQFSSYLTVIGVEPQRGINALSISQATNIPRETVRRKAKKMVKHDYLAEKGRARYITKPGYLQKPETVAVQRDVIRETMRFINMCLEVGAIKWVEPACATAAVPAPAGAATAGAATAAAVTAGAATARPAPPAMAAAPPK